MSVHEAISAHSRKQHAHLEEFKRLDQERERAIQEAISICSAGLPFSVDTINRITDLINAHANNGISPTRVRVNEDMVREYVEKHK